MRTSNFLLATLREDPSEAELISHKLMLRAGMIRKLVSGVYTWLPLGFRVLNKIINIIREEMDKLAMEILMPSVQPKELWLATGRWDMYGDQLLKMKDRNQHDLCYAPTHEEVITSLVRDEVRSYKQLPLVFYQIQNKFRDELRPRFGVMRGREFMMMDAYSFHLTEESMHQTYTAMYDIYCRIFQRMGLEFRAVLADNGTIGGTRSHEFQVLADSGEDVIAYSDEGSYAANLEFAEALKRENKLNPQGFLAKEKVATPGIKTVNEVTAYLKVSQKQVLKTLIVRGNQSPWVALVLRGDHELNSVKVAKIAEIYSPLVFAGEAELKEVVGVGKGSIGPLGLKIPLIVDQDAISVLNFICGANEEGFHYRNLNWGRDLDAPKVCDLRKVVEGDQSPDGKGQLKLVHGIEVGHVFELGRKYSESLRAKVLDEQGKALPLYMGCYGIGVTRLAAAVVEQNHDEQGIIWPEVLAPFSLVIIPVNYYRAYRVKDLADRLYSAFLKAGIEVILDDRRERLGVLFNDMDLVGIPHRIIISESNLEKGVVEYKLRTEKQGHLLEIKTVVEFLVAKLKHESK